jgi:hypothetical protein
MESLQRHLAVERAIRTEELTGFNLWSSGEEAAGHEEKKEKNCEEGCLDQNEASPTGTRSS